MRRFYSAIVLGLALAAFQGPPNATMAAESGRKEPIVAGALSALAPAAMVAGGLASDVWLTGGAYGYVAIPLFGLGLGAGHAYTGDPGRALVVGGIGTAAVMASVLAVEVAFTLLRQPLGVPGAREGGPRMGMVGLQAMLPAALLASGIAGIDAYLTAERLNTLLEAPPVTTTAAPGRWDGQPLLPGDGN